MLKSLDFGEILDFGLGYFRDRQHLRFMSCKPANTYGWSITISIVGWIRPVLFGVQRLVLCYWNTDFFWTRGNSPGSPFIIERRLHKKFVVKTLTVRPAILNIATGQNELCV